MLEFGNGGRLVQDICEIPSFREIDLLYADFETTSEDKTQTSLNPWFNCKTLGIAVTADKHKGAWYLPVRHRYGAWNVPMDVVLKWWTQVTSRCRIWVNHNVKYDAQVSANDFFIDPPQHMLDTVTLAKIVHSDRWSYSLSNLSKDWLHDDIDRFNEPFEPYLQKNKDFGAIPVDLMAEYACQDVLTERRLYGYLKANLHPDCVNVSMTEQSLTRILYEMERTGLCVDPQELQVVELQILNKMLTIEETLQEITGRSFRPHVNEDCFDVLCNQYGLPVLAWTNPGDENAPHNPSFDKAALKQYVHHPDSPVKVVKLIQKYRMLNTLRNFFVTPYQRFQIDGVMHSEYNQSVRTGRMSCKKPNAMQLSKAAKALVHPPEGHVFISCDASQIEFRIIAHYIRNQACIGAYCKNPDTDFHQWVADLVEIARKPAKTINFMMGYGGGRRLCVKLLSENLEVIAQIEKELNERLDKHTDPEDRLMAFDNLCKRRARDMYEKYHEYLPELKPTARRADNVAKQRGYVRNLYGRHRHIPPHRSRIAFNTLCQSTAADYVKAKMVQLQEYLNSTPVKIVSQVHDEILMIGPKGYVDQPCLQDILGILELPDDAGLRVPVRWSIGVSDQDWQSAGSDEAKQTFTYRGDQFVPSKLTV